jgi:ferredoxin
MNYRLLKKIRVVVSLLFLIFTGVLFLDLAQVFPESLINKITFLQFAPSLINFLSSPSILVAGFILVLLLTLFAGRLYCSTICPLGILQDVLSYVGRRFGIKRRYKYKKPLNWVRYPILILTIVVMASGSLWLVTLLDPYSNFGRIVNNLFRPVFVLLNNLVAIAFEAAGNYSVSRIDWKGLSLLTFSYSLALLAVVTLLALTRGRLYCNTLCPVGILLGRFARASAFRIRLDRLACTQCGKCSVVCKAECIDVKTREVDFERCVGCLNCLAPCPDNGVNFEFAWQRSGKQQEQDSKRNFIKSAGLLLLSALAIPSSGQAKRQRGQGQGRNSKEPIPVPRENHVMPPGAGTRYDYTSRCTACQLCVSSCPTQVLQPAVNELGFFFMMVPYMDYNTSFCNFECTRCTEVCPTGALQPLALDDKKLTQLGKVKFIKRNCIVKIDGTDCGACSEHCPTKAVYMIPFRGNLMIPEVNEDICIGCGACEYACPTDPKSIYVEGNREHVFADKPVEEELDKEIDYKEDFPF